MAIAKVRKAKYQDYEVVIKDGDSVDEVREYLSEIFPEVKHAQAETDGDGNITFTLVAGQKGF